MKDIQARLNQGQSLVELALLLPVLLFLTLIAFDLGRGVYYYSAVYNAAREGARWAIVHQCPRDDPCADTLVTDGIQEKAEDLAVGLGPNSSNFRVEPGWIGTDYMEIQVTVRYVFKLITPLANLLPSNGHYCGDIHMVKGEFCLTSSSTMAVER